MRSLRAIEGRVTKTKKMKHRKWIPYTYVFGKLGWKLDQDSQADLVDHVEEFILPRIQE
jgi:hypothetical protein